MHIELSTVYFKNNKKCTNFITNMYFVQAPVLVWTMEYTILIIETEKMLNVQKYGTKRLKKIKQISTMNALYEISFNVKYKLAYPWQ